MSDRAAASECSPVVWRDPNRSAGPRNGIARTFPVYRDVDGKLIPEREFTPPHAEARASMTARREAI